MDYDQLTTINAGASSRDMNDWNVAILDDDITQITVRLDNGTPNSTKRTRVNLGNIDYCGA